MSGARRLLQLVVAGGLLIGSGSCSSEPTTETTITTIASISDVEGPAYEVEVVDAGADPLGSVVAPAPVGSFGSVDVRRTEGGLVVAGLVEVEVLASAADGSGQTATLELVDVDSNDNETARAMIRAVGTVMTIERDQWSATGDRVLETPEDLDARYVLLTRQLLDSVHLFTGPLPRELIGVGARWTVRIRGADDSVTELDFELVAFDGQTYEIDVVFDGGTAQLSGRVGEAIPDSQGHQIGDASTTVVVRGS